MTAHTLPGVLLAPRNIRSRQVARAATFAIVVFFVALLLDALHHITKGEVGAFATYYKAATLLLAGRSPYAGLTGYPYVYPPLWAWICQPLATIPRDVAARLMMCINAALLLGSVILSAGSILKRFTGTAPLVRLLPISAIALVLVSVQVHKDLRSFQTDLVLMFGFAVAIALLDLHPAIAGASLAFVISVKYVPLITVPYLLFRKRWAALTGLGLGLMCWALLPASTLGLTRNLELLKQSLGGLSHLSSTHHTMAATSSGATSSEARVHGIADEMDHSITSAIVRLVERLHGSFGAAIVIDLILGIGWLGAMFHYIAGSVRSDLLQPDVSMQRIPPFPQRIALEWTALMTAAMVFSPSSLLIFAIYPAALCATHLHCVPRARHNFTTVAGALVLFLSLLLPISALGHAFTAIWNAAGVSCWMLLISATLLIRGASIHANQNPW